MEEKKEVLTFEIDITQILEVKGKTAEALMINFKGTADCENFKGVVLPGGVDTQKETYGENRTLSARYMLEGVDALGEKCHIFVENNGTAEHGMIAETTPRIITDSKALCYLEEAKLTGTITPKENGVIIHIFL